MAKIADRIEVNPNIHNGKLVIAGTRVPVDRKGEILISPLLKGLYLNLEEVF